jgi:hypothetical protein
MRGNCSHAALVELEFLGFRRHLRGRFLLNRSGPAPVFEQRQKRNPALDPCRNVASGAYQSLTSWCCVNLVLWFLANWYRVITPEQKIARFTIKVASRLTPPSS